MRSSWPIKSKESVLGKTVFKSKLLNQIIKKLTANHELNFFQARTRILQVCLLICDSSQRFVSDNTIFPGCQKMKYNFISRLCFSNAVGDFQVSGNDEIELINPEVFF